MKKYLIILSLFGLALFVMLNVEHNNSDNKIDTIPANYQSPITYLSNLSQTSSEYLSLTEDYEVLDYKDYLAQYSEIARPNTSVNVNIFDYETVDMDVVVETETIETGDSGKITWTVDVPTTGLYNIEIEYLPGLGTSANIERSLLINERLPFSGAKSLTFYRIWVDTGNIRLVNKMEVRPEKAEEFVWRKVFLADSRTFDTDAYLFYFESGENTISLESVREPMKIRAITLTQEPELKAYSDYINDLSDAPIYKGNSIVYQAERTDAENTLNIKTSSPMIYATPTYNDGKAQPFHPYYTRLNVIGGNNWRVLGDFVEWEINVPQSGLYQLTFRANQKANRGLFSSRELTINGEIPFAEAKQIPFYYSRNLKQYTFGNKDETYLFYFNEGINTIGMRVVYGDLGPIVEQVENTVRELNDLYRRIIQYTGVNPDPYVDYQLKLRIPGIVQMFTKHKTDLEQVCKDLIALTGSEGEDVAILKKMIILIDDIIEDPEVVTEKLNLYSSNVTAIGAWLLSVSEQSLSIDYFVLHSNAAQLPKNNTNFFAKIWYGVLRFFASFFIDVNNLSGDTNVDIRETITVWTPTSRDQAAIIRELIDNSFTPKTGIAVNLQIVPKDVILPATVAGRSPDVVIQIGQDMQDGASVGSNGLPINLAMRNATVELSNLPGFADIKSEFYDSAFTPVSFNGGVYALPETQDFLMLFYRKDILDSIGLEVPKTWDDVYNMVAALQINNYEFYLPPSIQTYSSFLYQRGGDLYKGEGLQYGIESALNDDRAVSAFEQYTGFYTNYSFSRSANFVNRFRSGEMPIGIANYIGVYNTLSVFAPEIKGLWEMAPIPGLRKEDGSINNTTVSDGLYTIMLSRSKKQDAAWEFMKWWVGHETQLNYGRKLETLLGSAGRYSTANVLALKELGWTKTQLAAIEEQMAHTVGYPEVPGGYMTIRQVNYAYYAVINDGIEPREALYLYITDLNKELTKKRKEFKLK